MGGDLGRFGAVAVGFGGILGLGWCGVWVLWRGGESWRILSESFGGANPAGRILDSRLGFSKKIRAAGDSRHGFAAGIRAKKRRKNLANFLNKS